MSKVSFRSGPARHRIDIQAKTPTRSGTGAEIPGWTSLGMRWAEIEPLEGGERFTAEQDLSKNVVRFVIRYDATIAALTATSRIVFDGRAYDIQFNLNQNLRNRKLLIHTQLSEARV